MDFQPRFKSEGTYTPDELVVGGPIKTDSAVLVSGQNLTRGTLLGKITTGGKLTTSLSASSDGSQTPYAILAEDCDASSGDKPCSIYIAGEFNQNSITFGTGHTAASTKDGLRDLNIYLVKPVAR